MRDPCEQSPAARGHSLTPPLPWQVIPRSATCGRTGSSSQVGRDDHTGFDPVQPFDNVGGGAVRCACKLGSIAIATLKILLGTVAFVGSGPTQQVSMQHFQLPHFVLPQPRPATERVWPSQTVALIEATVGWARFLAGRAAAAIAGAQEALLLAEVAMHVSVCR